MWCRTVLGAGGGRSWWVLLASCLLYQCTEGGVRRKHNTAAAYILDPAGIALTKPSKTSNKVGSPALLLQPDRYEFYTFDESGELIKRLMTLKEIQEIIAMGDGDDGQVLAGPQANLNKPPVAFNFQPPSHTNVHNIVSNVQTVLKAEMEAQKTNPPKENIFDTPNVSSSWSMILPAIFGNTGGSIATDSLISMHSVPETDVVTTNQKGEIILPEQSSSPEDDDDSYSQIEDLIEEELTNFASKTSDGIILNDVAKNASMVKIQPVDNLTPNQQTTEQNTTSKPKPVQTTSANSVNKDEKKTISTQNVPNMQAITEKIADNLNSIPTTNNIIDQTTKKTIFTQIPLETKQSADALAKKNITTSKPQILQTLEKKPSSQNTTEKINGIQSTVPVILKINSTTSKTTIQKVTTKQPEISYTKIQPIEVKVTSPKYPQKIGSVTNVKTTEQTKTEGIKLTLPTISPIVNDNVIATTVKTMTNYILNKNRTKETSNIGIESINFTVPEVNKNISVDATSTNVDTLDKHSITDDKRETASPIDNIGTTIGETSSNKDGEMTTSEKNSNTKTTHPESTQNIVSTTSKINFDRENEIKTTNKPVLQTKENEPVTENIVEKMALSNSTKLPLVDQQSSKLDILQSTVKPVTEVEPIINKTIIDIIDVTTKDKIQEISSDNLSESKEQVKNVTKENERITTYSSLENKPPTPGKNNIVNNIETEITTYRPSTIKITLKTAAGGLLTKSPGTENFDLTTQKITVSDVQNETPQTQKIDLTTHKHEQVTQKTAFETSFVKISSSNELGESGINKNTSHDGNEYNIFEIESSSSNIPIEYPTTDIPTQSEEQVSPGLDIYQLLNKISMDLIENDKTDSQNNGSDSNSGQDNTEAASDTKTTENILDFGQENDHQDTTTLTSFDALSNAINRENIKLDPIKVSFAPNILPTIPGDSERPILASTTVGNVNSFSNDSNIKTTTKNSFNALSVEETSAPPIYLSQLNNEINPLLSLSSVTKSNLPSVVDRLDTNQDEKVSENLQSEISLTDSINGVISQTYTSTATTIIPTTYFDEQTDEKIKTYSTINSVKFSNNENESSNNENATTGQPHSTTKINYATQKVVSSNTQNSIISTIENTPARLVSTKQTTTSSFKKTSPTSQIIMTVEDNKENRVKPTSPVTVDSIKIDTSTSTTPKVISTKTPTLEETSAVPIIDSISKQSTEKVDKKGSSTEKTLTNMKFSTTKPTSPAFEKNPTKAFNIKSSTMTQSGENKDSPLQSLSGSSSNLNKTDPGVKITSAKIASTTTQQPSSTESALESTTKKLNSDETSQSTATTQTSANDKSTKNNQNSFDKEKPTLQVTESISPQFDTTESDINVNETEKTDATDDEELMEMLNKYSEMFKMPTGDEDEEMEYYGEESFTENNKDMYDAYEMPNTKPKPNKNSGNNSEHLPIPDVLHTNPLLNKDSKNENNNEDPLLSTTDEEIVKNSTVTFNKVIYTHADLSTKEVPDNTINRQVLRKETLNNEVPEKQTVLKTSTRLPEYKVSPIDTEVPNEHIDIANPQIKNVTNNQETISDKSTLNVTLTTDKTVEKLQMHAGETLQSIENKTITNNQLNNNASASKNNSQIENQWKLVQTVLSHNETEKPIVPNKIVVQNTEQKPIERQPSPSDSLNGLTNYQSQHIGQIHLPGENEAEGLEKTTTGLSEDVFQFSQLCNELAFRYWKAVSSNGIDPKRSLAVSPFALTSILAMMFLGARGATSGEMNEILKLDDMVTFNPHIVFKNVTESIEVSKKSGVATYAFIREIFSDQAKGRLLSFYKERVQQFYSGHVEEVNFKNIGDIIRRRTNLLVKRHTWGKIPEYIKSNNMILSPPLSVFSANVFQTDCSVASTDGRDGEMYFVVSPTIRQRRLIPVPAVVYRSGFLAGYVPDLDATVVAIDKGDQIVSTIFVMPGQQGSTAQGDDIIDLQSRLLSPEGNLDTWAKLLKSLIARQGLELQIPRFSHRSVINGTAALKKMGLKDLFDSKNADLRGLNGQANDLYLSDIMLVNTFATCGEGIIGDQHHVEVYPGEPNKVQRRLWRNPYRPMIQDRHNSEQISEIWDEPRDYQRAFHDPLHDTSYLNMPLHLRPRQARLPDSLPEPPRLKFDRPFMFFVRHNPTGLILHMGRYNPRLLP